MKIGQAWFLLQKFVQEEKEKQKKKFGAIEIFLVIRISSANGDFSIHSLVLGSHMSLRSPGPATLSMRLQKIKYVFGKYAWQERTSIMDVGGGVIGTADVIPCIPFPSSVQSMPPLMDPSSGDCVSHKPSVVFSMPMSKELIRLACPFIGRCHLGSLAKYGLSRASLLQELRKANPGI
jgi:hypothetical protein